MRKPKIHAVGEDYLEAVLILQQKKGGWYIPLVSPNTWGVQSPASAIRQVSDRWVVLTMNKDSFRHLPFYSLFAKKFVLRRVLRQPEQRCRFVCTAVFAVFENAKFL